MKIARLLLSKTAITALVAIAGLIAFNSLYYKLETEQLAAFNEWHPTTQTMLQSENGEQASKSKLQITIRLKSGEQTSQWSFPTQSLANAEDRERTARILQLISESKVFGLPSSSSKSGESLSIGVSDAATSFSTTISGDAIKENIQLQNLLKLLEVYSSTPTQPVNPAQL
jgi:hypothetical protein